MRSWRDPKAHRIVRAIEILCPEDTIETPQSFSLSNRQRKITAWVCSLSPDQLDVVQAKLRADTFDPAVILKKQLLVELPTPGAPRPVPLTDGQRIKDLPPYRPHRRRQADEDEEKKQDRLVLLGRSSMPKFAHAGPELLGAAEWDSKRQSCFLDAVMIPFLYHLPAFMLHILVREPETYVATGASEEFRKAYCVTEMHRTVPLRALPELFEVAFRLRDVLRLAHEGATQGRAVSMAPIHDLIPMFEAVEERVTGRPSRREWRQSQEDAGEVVDELFRIFAVPWTAVRVESVWHDVLSDRPPEVLRRPSDKSNIVVLSPETSEEVVTLAREIVLKARCNPAFRTVSCEELVSAPYLLIQVSRRADEQGKLWRNKVEAPETLQTLDGSRLSLVAVVCRHGAQARGGHWNSVVKSKLEENVWIYLDGLKPRARRNFAQMHKECSETGTMFLYVDPQKAQ